MRHCGWLWLSEECRAGRFQLGWCRYFCWAFMWKLSPFYDPFARLCPLCASHIHVHSEFDLISLYHQCYCLMIIHSMLFCEIIENTYYIVKCYIEVDILKNYDPLINVYVCEIHLWMHIMLFFSSFSDLKLKYFEKWHGFHVRRGLLDRFVGS